MNKIVALALIMVAVVGITHANVSAEKSRAVAVFAVDQMGPGHTLIKVKSAKKKVVNGVLYELELVVRRQKLGGSEKLICDVKVLEKKHLSVKSSRCRKF